MRENVEIVVKVGLAIIKKSPNEYHEAVKSELSILDLHIDDQAIFVSGALVLEHKTLTNIRNVIPELSDEQFSHLAEAERLRLLEHKTRTEEDAKVKMEREKDHKKALAERNKATERIISELVKAFTPVLNQALNPPGFSEYTVIARMGDDSLKLRNPVNQAMADGWIPQGGIHIAGPLPNGVMLFSQAMVFPAGRKPKTYGY